MRIEIPSQKLILKKIFFPQKIHDFFLKRANIKDFPKTFNREARQIRHQHRPPLHHHQSHLVQRFPRCIHSHR